jgi:alanine dehydrogenase
MSAIAGHMAVTIGSYYLASCNHGERRAARHVLGTATQHLVIVGDGVVGQHAARTAWGAQVVLGGRDQERAQLKRDIARPGLFETATTHAQYLNMPISSWVRSSCARKHRTWSPKNGAAYATWLGDRR